MSRLDSFIRRMSAQRDVLNELSTRLQGIPGPIFEFGLGGGRTYDHLRQCFPDRKIVVFESVFDQTRPPRPMPEHLVIGDIRETSLQFADGCAAMVHSDINTGIEERDRELSGWLPALIERLLAPGGYAASGSDLQHSGLNPQPLPPTVQAGRYYVFRRA